MKQFLVVHKAENFIQYCVIHKETNKHVLQGCPSDGIYEQLTTKLRHNYNGIMMSDGEQYLCSQ